MECLIIFSPLIAVGMRNALGFLSFLYCFGAIMFSLCLVNEEPLEFDDVKGGAILISSLFFFLGLLVALKFSIVTLISLTSLFVIFVFLILALWIGLIVHKAVIATIVFLVIYSMAMGGTFYFFHRVVPVF
jgi:hypothetical protein